MKITVQGHSFDISETYSEGHTCNAVEAQALNALRGENIANNQRKTVQAKIDEMPKGKNDAGEEVPGQLTDKAIKELQAAIAEYDGIYVLNMTRGGGGRDPVQSMAREMAKSLLTKEVKGNNYSSLKAWRDEVGKEKYDEKIAEIAAKDKVQALAKRTVELEA